MDSPLLFHRHLQLREYRKLLAVRRHVVVRNSAHVLKSLKGPQARFAASERFVLHLIIRHHDTVVRILEEQLSAMARPDRQRSSSGGDLPLPAGTPLRNRKGPHIYFIPTRFIRFVSDPLTVR